MYEIVRREVVDLEYYDEEGNKLDTGPTAIVEIRVPPSDGIIWYNALLLPVTHVLHEDLKETWLNISEQAALRRAGLA